MNEGQKVVQRVLLELARRKGFDHLLDELGDDLETRRELESTLAELVNAELQHMRAVGPIELELGTTGPVLLVELNGVYVNPRHVVAVAPVQAQKPVQDAADKLGAMIWCVGGPGQNIGIVGMTPAQVAGRLSR